MLYPMVVIKMLLLMVLHRDRLIHRDSKDRTKIIIALLHLVAFIIDHISVGRHLEEIRWLVEMTNNTPPVRLRRYGRESNIKTSPEIIGYFFISYL